MTENDESDRQSAQEDFSHTSKVSSSSSSSNSEPIKHKKKRSSYLQSKLKQILNNNSQDCSEEQASSSYCPGDNTPSDKQVKLLQSGSKKEKKVGDRNGQTGKRRQRGREKREFNSY